MAIDRAELAEFLRRRRESLQPEDVGFPRGPRRRTSGLGREEVASFCHMSTDYYARLERERGPHPSEQMIASIAQGLHLSIDERDHLFRLAGHNPPPRGVDSDHISPGLLRILDRLQDTSAEIVTELGETCDRPRSGSHSPATRPATAARPAASATGGSATPHHDSSTHPKIIPS